MLSEGKLQFIPIKIIIFNLPLKILLQIEKNSIYLSHIIIIFLLIFTVKWKVLNGQLTDKKLKLKFLI